MKNYTLFFVLLLLLGGGLMLGQFFWNSGQNQLQLTRIAGKDFGGDFTLQAADKPVSLSDFRGKVVLIYFGYASCPDVCPTSMALLGTAMKRLEPAEAEQVQGILISVDPERDHGQKLMDYAQHFYPSFIGITGSLDDVKQVAGQYGSYFAKSESTSAMGYLVDHSSKTYVIGKDGQLVDLLPHDMTVPDIVATIRKSL